MGESIPRDNPHKNVEEKVDNSYVEMVEGQGPYAVVDKKEGADTPGMLMGFPLHHEDGTIRLHLWECQGNKNKFNDVITELIINGRTVEGLFVRIKVKRTSGATEDDWVINNYAPERKEFRVQKIKGPEGKWQSIRDLEEQNL